MEMILTTSNYFAVFNLQIKVFNEFHKPILSNRSSGM